jgi:hypothetical protein
MLQDRHYNSTMRAGQRLTGDQTLAYTAGAEEPLSGSGLVKQLSVPRSLPKAALNLRLEEFEHFDHEGAALHHATVGLFSRS